MAHTILVVDDEPRIVSVIESYLAQYGYRVVNLIMGKRPSFWLEGKARLDHSRYYDASHGWP